jgi:hypothetical protein
VLLQAASGAPEKARRKARRESMINFDSDLVRHNRRFFANLVL